MLIRRVRKDCNLADEARHVKINQKGEARRCKIHDTCRRIVQLNGLSQWLPYVQLSRRLLMV